MTCLTTIARPGALIAIASSLLAIAAPAFAQLNDDSVPQGRLSVAGIDFTSAKSVDHLKAQVRHLAYAICVPAGDGRAIMATDQRICYDEAIRTGMAGVAARQQMALRAKLVDVASTQGDTRPAH